MKRSILVANDLRLSLESEATSRLLAGFEILMARTGDQAVELARQRLPSLILLDFQMPGLSGVEACAVMRREPSLGLTPIMIMSAKGSPETRERCLQAGCTEFVVTPENRQELLGILARILSGRRRKAVRIAVIFSMTDTSGGRQTVGRATDPGGTGMLLVSSKPLMVNMVLKLEFVVPRSHQTVTARGKIVRATQNAEGDYEAGVHFVDLGQSEQQAILEYVAG